MTKPSDFGDEEAATILTPRADGPTPGSGSGAFSVDLARFELKEKLGSGGNAVVYRAIDLASGQPVALKLIEEGQEDDLAQRTRFEREVRAAGRLVHENICRVIGFGSTSDKGVHKRFIAMELVEGTTLHKAIKLAGTLPVPVALEVLRQLLRALACAGDAGVVHRDLKPTNVMLTPSGRLRLLDFGIAKSEGDATVTAAGLLIGTPAFMSPEQVIGEAADARSDLFSAGVCLLVMLSGRLRFQGLDPAAVMVKVGTEPVPSLLEDCPTASSQVDAFLQKLCAQQPARRFQSAREALAALEQLDDTPVLDDGQRLLARYLAEPADVAAELAQAEAFVELVRAERLLQRGDAALPAAALALYRASLLAPEPETRKKLEAACKRGRVTFEPIDDDPAIADAYAAFMMTPASPDVVGRLADLYFRRGQVVYAAAFLTRYLGMRPGDVAAAERLSLLVEGPQRGTGTGTKLKTGDIAAGKGAAGKSSSGTGSGKQRASPSSGNHPVVRPPANLGDTASRERLRAAQIPLPGSPAEKSAAAKKPPAPNVPAHEPSTGSSAGARPRQRPAFVVQAHQPPRVSVSIPPGAIVAGAVVVVVVAIGVFAGAMKKEVSGAQRRMHGDDRAIVADRPSAAGADAAAGELAEARRQLARGNAAEAIRRVSAFLATNPAGDQVQHAIFLRAQARMQLEEWRAAKADLEEFIQEADPKDPRRADAKKLLEEVATHTNR